MSDTVLLRRYRPSYGGGILAILTEAPANPGRVLCYEHVGQHGEGVYSTILQITTPADPCAPDSREMLAELRSMGYDPAPSKRMARTRKAVLK